MCGAVMGTMRCLAFAVALLAADAVSMARELARIPFSLGTDSRIYVSCRVNDSDTLRFLFDIGATDMVVNTASPRAGFTMCFDSEVTNSGASGSGVVPASSDNEFYIGGMSAGGLRFIGIEYPPEAWDGVVGLSFIGKYPFRIDYGSMEIVLYDSDGFVPPRDGVPVRVSFVLGVPVIPVSLSVNGSVYDVLVELDTGSDRVFDLNTPFVRDHGLLGSQSPFAISRISSSDSGSGELLNVYFDWVSLGGWCLYRVPGAFSTVSEGVQASDLMDGVLGNNLLQRFDAVYDLPHGLVWFEPNDLLYKPFYDFLIR